MSEPRGLRLCNPGCIRRTGTVWKGQSPQQLDPDFVTFIGPEWGMRAIIKILDSYQREGVRTIRGAISRWSPPSDNNPTDEYVDHVAKVCGVDPDAPILLSVHRDDLVVAITTQECGEWPYDLPTLRLAVELAEDA